jgi:hypothetical protein
MIDSKSFNPSYPKGDSSELKGRLVSSGQKRIMFHMPTTAAGKAISSRNAIRHGLTSVSPILPSEDPAEFEAFQSNVVTQYDPQDAEDTAIVSSYVDTMWRLRRIPAQESRLIAIEVLRMKLSAKDDPALANLLTALGDSDPIAIEALALDRLSNSKTLLNLHRQEQRLNNKLKALKPDLDRIMMSSKKRYVEYLNKQKAAAQIPQEPSQQNELSVPEVSNRIERLLKRIA